MIEVNLEYYKSLLHELQVTKAKAAELENIIKGIEERCKINPEFGIGNIKQK